MGFRSFLWILLVQWGAVASAQENPSAAAFNPLAIPLPGSHELRILSSNLLELTLITSKEPDPAPVTEWNFVDAEGNLDLPDAFEFEVRVDDLPVPVQVMGFKRRPIYAPLAHRDLRIANHLYLKAGEPIADGQTAQVTNPGETLWSSAKHFIATKDPFRRSPLIHVNQVGYAPTQSKQAMIGFYLGSAGEMSVTPTTGFSIINTATREVVFQGPLAARSDVGYLDVPLPYQNVLEADFSEFDVPGEYFLQVPDLGVSFPFRIGEGILPTFARTYALGLYHQRCGAPNSSPFTRHTHETCHTNMAEVPTMSFLTVNALLAKQTANFSDNPRHAAPQLANVDASLYPFINTNRIDVSGGHHDAGDYSKYTINSAQLIHALIFAVDAFPGVSQLDNLGLPESGDGISDVLQIAKWEADFLAKMQDADGGFYFLVYPRDRPYEYDVLPDRGDPQVVFPKTTSATAAAVAALAQTASSPLFKQHYPAESDLYLQKALRGWQFLSQAIATHRRDGAYQQITHYGDVFMHDDELDWAATELFLATGEKQFHDYVQWHFDPTNVDARRWTWWRLFEGYGCAARSYAFAARTGRLPPEKLDPVLLAKCQAEIFAAAEDQLINSQKNAYRLSFPIEHKVFRVASWFFPINQAYDLAVGYQLFPKPEYIEAILNNINYEAGCNPVNATFLTGIGQKRQREIVHQVAQNDRRVLPPSGIPVGALQSDFAYLENYKTELANLTFPSDEAAFSGYAPYDRWADSFNPLTESVVPQQARGLATTAFLWADFGSIGPLWQSGQGVITNVPIVLEVGEEITVGFSSSEDLTEASIVWEARDQEPFFGKQFKFSPVTVGPQWIEADVLLADGRRIFAATNFVATFPMTLPPNSYQSNTLNISPEMTALYHFNFDMADSTGKQPALALRGNARFDDANVGWLANRWGAALRFENIGDTAAFQIFNQTLRDANTETLVLEAMIYVVSFKAAAANVPLISLVQNWNASLEFQQNPYDGLNFRGGTHFFMNGSALSNALPRNQWHHLRIALGKTGYSVRINGQLLTFFPSGELRNWAASEGASTLILGNFEGWIDELGIRDVKTNIAITMDAAIGENAQLLLQLAGKTGTEYLLQTSTDLHQWTARSTNSLSNSSEELILSTDGEQRFFRVLPIP